LSYTQLTQEQRYQIHALMKMGLQHTEIADYLEIHKSTTSSQQGIARLSTQASTAESHAHRNHARKRINAETWLLIEAKLHQEWGPEQVSGWLKRRVGIEISHEWINTS
jgi:IS30 family transposase